MIWMNIGNEGGYWSAGKTQEKSPEPYQWEGRIKRCPCQRDCGAKVPTKRKVKGVGR